jgi:hypothetical protein
MSHAYIAYGARGSVVAEATSWKVAGSIPHEVIDFFNLPNLFGSAIALGFTQNLTEMSTRSRKFFLGSRARRMRRTDNLTAICEPTV